MRLTIRARLERCPRCDAAIIRAMTAPPAAYEARADPVPLSAAEEIRALLAGRMTYDLAQAGAHQELIWRDQFRIKARDHPVLASHRCPGPVPWTAIPTPATPQENTGPELIPY